MLIRNGEILRNLLRESTIQSSRNYQGVPCQEVHSWSRLVHRWLYIHGRMDSLCPATLRAVVARLYVEPSSTATAYNGWLSRFQAFTMSTCWFSLRAVSLPLGTSIRQPDLADVCWEHRLPDFTSNKRRRCITVFHIKLDN